MLVNLWDFVGQFRYGNMNIIRFVHQHGYKLPESAMETAATYGHTELVKFLHKLGDPIVSCTTEAMDHLSFRHNLDVVQFLYENRSKGCTANATDSAWQRKQSRDRSVLTRASQRRTLELTFRA